MRRRDFLLVRTERASSVAELSCERLYMHYQQVRAVATGDIETSDADDWDEGATSVQWNSADRAVAWGSVDALFRDVTRGLAGADELRLSGVQWLADVSFARRVRDVLDRFRRHGGRVG